MRWPLASVLLATGLAAAVGADEDKPSTGLEIVRLDLLDRKGGYAIDPESVYYPGESVHVAFNIRGYSVDERDDYRMRVSYRIRTTSPLDKPFAMAEGGEWNELLAQEAEGWEPLVTFDAVLPQYAGSGVYKVLIEVTDELAEKSVSREVPIRVQGMDVETSDEFSIRNFSFSYTDGGTPLSEPIGEPGRPLWASFYITGYEMGEDNSYDVESELNVIDSEGKSMYTFDPRGEKGAPDFPRLWLPAKFRLDLDDDIPAGKYTVLLEARDKVGRKTFQSEEAFEVR